MAEWRFALEQLSALEFDPLAFVDVAAEAGYQAIGLHLESLPAPHAAPYDLISDRPLFEQVVRRIEGAGLQVHVVEPFLITPETGRDVHLRNLDLGARLGAAVAGTLAFDPDEGRRRDRLGQLEEDARARGIGLTIEPWWPSSWPTLSAAAAAAAEVGGGAGVTLDVLHVVRGGEHWEAVSKLPRGLIKTVQLSDGPLQTPASREYEAIAERMVPGEGQFDLARLVPLLPPHLPIGIEAPSQTLAERMPPAARMRHLLERTRALLATAAQRGGSA
jgi:sugar phosphate isomerase/epimerase